MAGLDLGSLGNMAALGGLGMLTDTLGKTYGSGLEDDQSGQGGQQSQGGGPFDMARQYALIKALRGGGAPAAPGMTDPNAGMLSALGLGG